MAGSQSSAIVSIGISPAQPVAACPAAGAAVLRYVRFAAWPALPFSLAASQAKENGKAERAKRTCKTGCPTGEHSRRLAGEIPIDTIADELGTGHHHVPVRAARPVRSDKEVVPSTSAVYGRCT